MIVLIPEFFNLSYINLVFSREVSENGWQFRMSSSGEIVPLGELGYKAGLARCRTRAPPNDLQRACHPTRGCGR